MSDTRLWWMSVALTAQAVRDRVKTQTRRHGWHRLHPGDQLALCPKYRGVRRENRELITIVDVLSVRQEPLRAITPSDVVAEGFPDWTPTEFIAFFCRTHRGVDPDTEITRIEWSYDDKPLKVGVDDAHKPLTRVDVRQRVINAHIPCTTTTADTLPHCISGDNNKKGL
ncbi:hypothetical protein QDT91_29715 (plasmid) [Mycolicibacterium aubagnense]|uniref:hypothetical protein n=1 Tax=Mycolicibacterium aubagnense TaxID=319707 RepID=UPI00244DD32C|nr:hypothetical protein [Mycolicibacterium aubagnense]WGI36196.1 hypothetical protein QDT91_29715 [Mycolicibacterium aubagnense]